VVTLFRCEQGLCIYGSFWWVLRCVWAYQDQCAYLPDTAYEALLQEILNPSPSLCLPSTLIEALGVIGGVWPFLWQGRF
jgi:hypothetical protein